jgi:hypothetical protein
MRGRRRGGCICASLHESGSAGVHLGGDQREEGVCSVLLERRAIFA